MAEAIKKGDGDKAKRWILKAIETPIRVLRRRYPGYSLPRDCKRLGELYLENRVPYSQVEDAIDDLSEDARDIGTENQIARDEIRILLPHCDEEERT